MVHAYCLEEIVAEKLRALLQNEARRAARAGSGRVAATCTISGASSGIHRPQLTAPPSVAFFQTSAPSAV